MGGLARDLKNDDTTDIGFDLLTDQVTSPVAADVGVSRIDVGSSTTYVPMSSSNPLYSQLTAGTAEIGNVANSGTFAVQVDGAALTSLQLIDDAVYTDATGTPSKGIAVMGTDGTNPQLVSVDANGHVQIDVLSSALPSGAATETKQDTLIGHVDGLESSMTDAVTALQIMDDWDESNRAKVNPVVGQAGVAAGAGAVGVNTQRMTLASDDPAVALLTTMDVDTGNCATHLSTLAGAVSGSEMQVDVLTMPTVTVDLGSNNDIQGQVAHDAAVSGNPVHVGAEARSSEGTAVANGDATRVIADLVGKLITSPYAPSDLLVNGRGTSTGTSDTSVIAAQGASVRTYVTSLQISNSSATDVTVDIKDGTTTKMTVPAPGNGGAVVNLPAPLQLTANTALQFASSASATTIAVSAQGYTGR